MTVDALSIVHPAVQQITSGTKTIEIRSWLPPCLPLYSLALVENHTYLHQDGEEDENGLLLAFVDVVGAHDWSLEEALRGDKQGRPGYHAWELRSVRPLANPVKAIAKRGVYPLEIDAAIWLQLQSGSGTR